MRRLSRRQRKTLCRSGMARQQIRNASLMQEPPSGWAPAALGNSAAMQAVARRARLFMLFERAAGVDVPDGESSREQISNGSALVW